MGPAAPAPRAHPCPADHQLGRGGIFPLLEVGEGVQPDFEPRRARSPGLIRASRKTLRRPWRCVSPCAWFRSCRHPCPPPRRLATAVIPLRSRARIRGAARMAVHSAPPRMRGLRVGTTPGSAGIPARARLRGARLPIHPGASCGRARARVFRRPEPSAGRDARAPRGRGQGRASRAAAQSRRHASLARFRRSPRLWSRPFPRAVRWTELPFARSCPVTSTSSSPRW